MKSKIILLLAISIISAASLYAQKNGPSFFSVSGGVSVPTGNWSKSSEVVSINGFANDNNGYAKTGGLIAADGAWFFKNFGLGGMISYSSYDVNLEDLSQGYQESFDVDQTTTTVSSYKIWNFLPGIYFSYPVQKKLSVTARLLAGVMAAKTPNISVDVEDGGTDDGTLQQESASKTAFAYNVGVGLSYKIIKCLGVNLRADYLYSKPDFTIENTLRNNSAGREITSYNQPLAAVNISLGVAYIFSQKK